MSRGLRWGLIGASDIAKTRMIEAINGQSDSAVVAIMSTSEERAKDWQFGPAPWTAATRSTSSNGTC